MKSNYAFAIQAAIKASGKNVYRADNGQELEYNKENLLNYARALTASSS